MDIGRAFMEGLARHQGDFLATLHPHDHRALQHIDKTVGVMTVHRVGAPWRIGHLQDQHFLARVVGQRLGHHRGNGGRRRAGGRGLAMNGRNAHQRYKHKQ
ncbi:hypothetical protein D9M71_716260 [compost metagenome]